MAAISTHLHVRPYQVAVTTDPALPYDKWKQLGINYAPTHRSAAYAVYKGDGDIVGESTGFMGVVFLFSCGLSVQVHI